MSITPLSLLKKNICNENFEGFCQTFKISNLKPNKVKCGTAGIGALGGVIVTLWGMQGITLNE